jgi:hypothetical protein
MEIGRQSTSRIMRQLYRLAGLLWLVFVGHLGVQAELDEEAFTRKLKILPLGDSITETLAEASYRYPLWRQMLDFGIDPEFLGTRDDTVYLDSEDRPRLHLGRTYDGDHEGHWGWTTDEVLREMDGWLVQYDVPDVALVHLGTNDVYRGQSDSQTVKELKLVFAKLRERNPEMLIVVAQIFPGVWGDVGPLNALIEDLYSEEVLIADCYTTIDVYEDTYDGAHPNASGGDKMAEAWWKVLKPWLGEWRQDYERWETKYGTSLPKHIDTDRDGWSNYQEFGALSDPLDGEVTPLDGILSGNFSNPFDPLRLGQGTQMQTSSSPLGPFQEAIGEEQGIALPNDAPLFIRWVFDDP